MSGSADYERRVREQIEQYAATANIHDLPPIFHFWSHNYLRLALIDVFAVESVADFYATGAIEAAERSGQPPSIISIGCGDGAVEADVASALLVRGIRNFQIIGTDISPILLGRMRDRIARKT